MKLSEIAARAGARLENCAEDPEIFGVASIDAAAPGQITFVASSRHLIAARNTHASAIILPEGYAALPMPMLRADDAYLLLAHVLEIFFSLPEQEREIHPTAVIDPSAKIGPNVSVGAYVVIGRNVEIGADSVLFPHVVIYRGARIGRNFVAHANAVVREDCRLGDNVILQNGAIIGADGFGFAKDNRDGEATWKKVIHPGPVVLGDNVEVQANACVARADIGETRVGREVKIGSLALVGHESSIGERSIVLPQVGVAGAARIGKDVMLLAKAGVVDACTIGDGVVVMAGSLVIDDVNSRMVVGGYPAMGHKSWLRSVALFKRLPELARRLRASSVKHE